MKPVDIACRRCRPLGRALLPPLIAGGLLLTQPALGGAAPAAATAEDGKGKGTPYRVNTTLVRPYEGRDTRRYIIVYTPPGYNDAANAHRRYPVLYLLHGSPGNPFNFVQYGDWLDAMNTLIAAGGVRPALLVIPNGNYVAGPKGDSEWANSADGRDRFEDWLVREIVAWTDKNFRTEAAPGGRIVGGVSEGGYGSVNLALRHPDTFGAVLACSGYYRIGATGWEHTIFGDNEALWQINSPLAYVDAENRAGGRRLAAWRRLRIYLGAGTNEKRYTDETREMAAKLRAAGVSAVTLDLLPGKHGWEIWHSLFVRGVKTLLGSGAPAVTSQASS